MGVSLYSCVFVGVTVYLFSKEFAKWWEKNSLPEKVKGKKAKAIKQSISSLEQMKKDLDSSTRRRRED